MTPPSFWKTAQTPSAFAGKSASSSNMIPSLPQMNTGNLPQAPCAASTAIPFPTAPSASPFRATPSPSAAPFSHRPSPPPARKSLFPPPRPSRPFGLPPGKRRGGLRCYGYVPLLYRAKHLCRRHDADAHLVHLYRFRSLLCKLLYRRGYPRLSVFRNNLSLFYYLWKHSRNDLHFHHGYGIVIVCEFPRDDFPRPAAFPRV